MLIRLNNLELIEYPDDLGALVMADIIRDEEPRFSIEEINLLINGVLAPLYDEKLTLEQNINDAKVHCSHWGIPDDAAMLKGFTAVRQYNENVSAEQIGYVRQELVSEYYCTKSNRKAQAHTIEQNFREVKPLPELTAPTGSQPTAIE
jgi:hypothetical protein